MNITIHPHHFARTGVVESVTVAEGKVKTTYDYNPLLLARLPVQLAKRLIHHVECRWLESRLQAPVRGLLRLSPDVGLSLCDERAKLVVTALLGERLHWRSVAACSDCGGHIKSCHHCGQETACDTCDGTGQGESYAFVTDLDATELLA